MLFWLFLLKAASLYSSCLYVEREMEALQRPLSSSDPKPKKAQGEQNTD